MIYSINERYIHRGAAYYQQLGTNIGKLNRELSDSEYFNWKIMIPRDYARMESNKKVHPNDVESIDHYTIYITKQIGTVHNRRDCFVYCQFPGSDRLFKVILYMDGGVGYDKMEHKYMLRVTDELDRRIVLGFCKMYQHSLVNYCYDDYDKPNWWIQNNAAEYTCKDMPKRIKTGSEGNNYSYKDLKPYEEYTIFAGVALI